MAKTPISFSLDSSAFRKAAAEAPKVYFRHLRDGMRRAGAQFEKEYVARRLSGAGSSSLARRSGNLRRIFAGRAVAGRDLDTLHLTIGFGPPAVPTATGGALKYVSIHETGGTIVPKKAKHLWIPAEPNQTPAGLARMSPTNFMANPNRVFMKWGRGYVAALRMFRGSKSKLGPALGKQVSTKVMFYLAQRVTIPARLHFGDDIAAYWPRAQEYLAVATMRASAEVSGGGA